MKKRERKRGMRIKGNNKNKRFGRFSNWAGNAIKLYPYYTLYTLFRQTLLYLRQKI